MLPCNLDWTTSFGYGCSVKHCFGTVCFASSFDDLSNHLLWYGTLPLDSCHCLVAGTSKSGVLGHWFSWRKCFLSRGCSLALKNAAQLHSLGNARLNFVESGLEKPWHLLALRDCFGYINSKARYLCFRLRSSIEQDHWERFLSLELSRCSDICLTLNWFCY